MPRAADISNEVKKFRAEFGLTQNQAGNIFKIPAKTISCMEQGRPATFPEFILEFMRLYRENKRLNLDRDIV